MRVKIIILLNALIYIILLPLLEVGATHVFNPDWPGHARLHEIWQLATNAIIALFILWLVFVRQMPRVALSLSFIVNGAFVFAFALKPFYNGTMQHSDGSELLLFGINPSVIILAFLAIGSFLMLFRTETPWTFRKG